MLLTEKLHLLSPIGGIPKQSSQDSGACTEHTQQWLNQCGDKAMRVQS